MYVCVCVCVNECVELNHFAIYLKLTHCKLTMRALLCMLSHFSCVLPFATPWTIAH